MDKDNNKKNEKKEGQVIHRRDIIKGLATLPVVGAFFYSLYKKRRYDKLLKQNLSNTINLDYKAPEAPSYKVKASDKQIRLGIIGFGGRGEHIVRAAGYAHPDKLKDWHKSAQKNNNDHRYEEYLRQDDLNIVINGVCDVFDVRKKRAAKAGANSQKTYKESELKRYPKIYDDYKALLAAKDIDAVIIATPDHWHAKMIIEAAKTGKHVYSEKAMTRTIDEAFAVRKAVKENNIIFQLGHQGRQTESYIKAEQAYEKGTIGKVTLVQVNTNRNDPNGAWVYDIHPDASPKTIDWKKFLGNAPKKPFNKKHFFRWRCWWDYGTGLSGDLFTHEFDAVNQIMKMGIPNSVVSSGGVYFYQDGREVPDVYQVACEYPGRDFTLLYSATLASDKYRGKIFMGHDGNMEVGKSLIINADKNSTKYKDKIKAGIIDPSIPIYHYKPGMKDVDAITSATEAYFAGRGLLYTYRDGKRYDTTHLHVKEWLSCIRNNMQPSCNIDRGFEEAISAHMGTTSYLNNCKVYWDADKEKVVKGEKA